MFNDLIDQKTQKSIEGKMTSIVGRLKREIKDKGYRENMGQKEAR